MFELRGRWASQRIQREAVPEALDARAGVLVTPMSRSPHGIEPDLVARQQAAGYRSKGAPRRFAPVPIALGEPPRRTDLALDRLGLKVTESQELTRFRVQCDPQTFAEKAKREAVRCSRDRHQTSGSSGGLAYAPVCYVASMYRKLLDQPVEFR